MTSYFEATAQQLRVRKKAGKEQESLLQKSDREKPGFVAHAGGVVPGYSGHRPRPWLPAIFAAFR